MTYSAKAIISVETGLPTSQIDVFQVEKNDQLLYKHLDLIEENRTDTLVRLANYQRKIRRGYNKGVKGREFIPGDLVLKCWGLCPKIQFIGMS